MTDPQTGRLSIGLMRHVCGFCGAKHFLCEKTGGTSNVQQLLLQGQGTAAACLCIPSILESDAEKAELQQNTVALLLMSLDAL